MKFAWCLAAVMVLNALSTAQPVRAQEASVASSALAEEREVEPGVWSFGAGVAGFYSSDGVLFGGPVQFALTNDAASFSQSSTIATTLIERKLSETLRLGLGVAGSYRSFESDDEGEVDIPEATAKNLEVGVSLRYVVNPRDRVQLSPLVALAGGWGKISGVALTRQYDSTQSSTVVGDTDHERAASYASLRFGLALEYRLLPRLYLRLENMFVRANYEYGEGRERRVREGEKTTTSDTDYRAFNVAASVQPALQLRIVF